ncbi:hypothetical protein LCGC14_2266660, partial [marine sediment metagenome]
SKDNTANAISLTTNQGAGETITITNTQGTGTAAVELVSSAGGVTFTAATVYASSDLDVVDNITTGDIVIDETDGVLNFSGATSAGISATADLTLSTTANNEDIAINPNGSGDVTIGSAGLVLSATEKLYFDGEGDTYIDEVSADNFSISVGGIVGAVKIIEASSMADFRIQKQVVDFAIVNTTSIGEIQFYGDDETASADEIGGQIEVIGTGTWTDGAEDAKMVLNVADNGTLNANQLVLNTDGTVTFGGGIALTGDLTITKDDPAIYYDPSTASESEWWTGTNHDGGGADNDVFEIRQSATPGTNVELGIEPDGDIVVAGDVTVTGDDISLDVAGVKLSGADGVLTILGLGNGNDLNLIYDLDNHAVATTVGVSSGAATIIDWGTIGITTTGAFTSLGIDDNAIGTILTIGDATVTVATATTWDMGAVATLDFDGATSLTTSGNNLLTLNGGTTGIRADQMFGINVAPTSQFPVYFAPSATNLIAGAGYGFFYNPTLIGYDQQNQLGMTIVPASITADATTGNITECGTMEIREPIITKTGANNIITAYTLKILDAPSEGVSNYAFWVSTGESRFDGAFTSIGIDDNANATA